MAASDNGALRSLILPGEGVTAAERYLARLCKRSFLSLWSYPAVFRDQGRPGGKGDGKEVCDLLVVFENNVIIFSDKDCEFRGTGDLEQNGTAGTKKPFSNLSNRRSEQNVGSSVSRTASSWIGNVEFPFQLLCQVRIVRHFTA